MPEDNKKDKKEEKDKEKKQQESNKDAKQEKENKKAEEDKSGSTENEEVEVPKEFEDIVRKIEEMSVLQLSELVKVLEKKFGVSAATPVAVAAGAVSGGESKEEEGEEKTSFDVELTEAGGSKIAVIKAIRAVTQLGLKDAKDLVDGAPKIVKESVSKEEAEEIKKQLEEAGAKVTLK